MSTHHSTPAETHTNNHAYAPAASARHFAQVEDVLTLANHLVTAVAIVPAAEQAVIARAKADWETAMRLIGDRAQSRDHADQERRAMGFFLALRVIDETPDALWKALDDVQDRVLVALLPTIVALMDKRDKRDGPPA